MNKERLDLLQNYLKYGKTPILIKNVSPKNFNNLIIIKADIDKSELNGHYEETDFCPPNWYKELVEKCKTNNILLLIENINEIPVEEQTKFVEIIKYKKVSTFKLPENCLVVATCSDLEKNKINEEVYSLFAQI